MKSRLCWLFLSTLALAQGQAGWQFYATDANAYQATADRRVFRTGDSSVHLQSRPAATAQSFGLYWQKIDAARYRGQRLRLTAYIRSDGVRGWAGMWMRIDPKHGPALEFENMQRRPIQGSTDWKAYTVELEVAELAEEVHFGCLLVGLGEVWFDDLSLVPTGPFQAGRSAARRARNLPMEPIDPGFEAIQE